MIDQFRGETRWLSNFEYATFVYKGVIWKTTEHAYQAMKCMNTVEFLSIVNASTPKIAKDIGQVVTMHPLFDQNKVRIMLEVNRCKFQQNPHLRVKLLATGDEELIEGNTWQDRFWGVCEGTGRNELGKVLMVIREELRQ